MKKFYFGTNTKMYMTAEETSLYVSDLISMTEDIDRDRIELFVLPPFTAIRSAREAAPPSRLTLGSQTVSWADEGQFTGEISPRMIIEAGASLCMVGHSERRHTFHETDEEANGRVRCALRNGLRVLLCVGETIEDKELGISDERIAIQLKTGLKNVSGEELSRIWLAYEPVWAIGTGGKPADPSYVESRQQTLRNLLCRMYGENGSKVALFYGGSINLENAGSFASQPSVDGLFIGRSAWRAENFNRIIREVLCVLEQKTH
ncbi:MAG: triose-phosphate isomerase [Dehalococcoidales bacterium]|nr:triose-phosphate isomerase [Dehalococcoidales bacterium]